MRLPKDVAQFIKPLLQFFSQIGSPFYINAYPFLAYKSDPEHIDINYALFKKNAVVFDTKTNLHYDNMFDAQIDAGYEVLEKAGFGKMEVIMSETGWALRGDENENEARTYNYNLKKKLAKKKGTPHRPKIKARAYVFALFNDQPLRGTLGCSSLMGVLLMILGSLGLSLLLPPPPFSPLRYEFLAHFAIWFPRILW
ncbi:hypothetical protein TIFTF001_019175 [Ficus carica]|uniref:glucan endo-1,3-beta-D-glucosidase n=1 Tax=Ficus carica TaxID=3494 RepID=A0AA88ADV4_FICCA|nr:hypothetical protein TIFTF001_019175 [Ficus carica]